MATQGGTNLIERPLSESKLQPARVQITPPVSHVGHPHLVRLGIPQARLGTVSSHKGTPCAGGLVRHPLHRSTQLNSIHARAHCEALGTPLERCHSVDPRSICCRSLATRRRFTPKSQKGASRDAARTWTTCSDGESLNSMSSGNPNRVRHTTWRYSSISVTTSVRGIRNTAALSPSKYADGSPDTAKGSTRVRREASSRLHTLVGHHEQGDSCRDAASARLAAVTLPVAMSQTRPIANVPQMLLGSLPLTHLTRRVLLMECSQRHSYLATNFEPGSSTRV